VSIRLILIAGLSLSMASTAAQARERTLSASGRDVFVWRSKDAQNEGMRLIDAGVLRSNPTLVIRLISCIVPAGTRAIITDHGFATHDILVTSGPSSGCRGNVPVEFVR